jgi:type VI protein secretion system component VasK
MTIQQHPKQPGHPAIVHTEALMDRMAHDFGYFLGRTYTRLQHATHAMTHHEPPIQSQAEQRVKQTEGSIEQTSRIKRSEEVVDTVADRLAALADEANKAKTSLQRAVSRLHEDAEDVLAKAREHHRVQHEPLPL